MKTQDKLLFALVFLLAGLGIGRVSFEGDSFPEIIIGVCIITGFLIVIYRLIDIENRY